MRFDSVRLGDGLIAVTLPIANTPSGSPYILKSIENLTTQVGVQIARLSNGTSKSTGRRPENVNLSLIVKTNPQNNLGLDVYQLRDRFYKLISSWFYADMPIYFVKDGVDVLVLYGRIDKVTPELFSNNPLIQIQVACTTPYFAEKNAKTISLNGSTSPVLENTGSVESFFYGLIGQIQFNTDHLRLYGFGPTQSLYIRHNFTAGDYVQYSSEPGSRKIVTFASGGSEINLLPKIEETRDPWLYIPPGGYNVSIDSPGAVQWYSYTYTPKHWGL